MIMYCLKTAEIMEIEKNILLGHGRRKMILSMGAGQLDLWQECHTLIITLLPSCFKDDIKIENFVYVDDIKVSGSLF